MGASRKKARGPQVPPAELERIGRRLAERRETAGLSRLEAAEAAGITYSGVSQIETGQATPTLGTLYALSTALGCHPAEPLGGRPPVKASPATEADGGPSTDGAASASRSSKGKGRKK